MQEILKLALLWHLINQICIKLFFKKKAIFSRKHEGQHPINMLKRHRLDPYMQNSFSVKFTKFNYQLMFEIGFFPKVTVCEN